MSDEGEPEITIDARRFAGDGRMRSRSRTSPDEVTMDFIQMDPVESRGMVVARVTCSPTFFELDGQRFVALDDGPQFAFT